jgi:FkbM family methyltransferase
MNARDNDELQASPKTFHQSGSPYGRTVQRIWAVSLIREIANQTVTKRYHDRLVQVPIIGNVSPSKFLEHEPQVDSIISALLDRYQGAFIDVGANTGQTLLKIVTANPGQQYIGFDASIFCAYYVDRLIKLNGFENCTILPIGLSDRTGVLNLQYARDADGAATVVENFWVGSNTKQFRQSIFVEAGDTILPSLEVDAIAAIKVDVEGGELEVLSGLKETLTRSKPAVVLEVLPYSCDDDGTDRTRSAVAMRQRRIETLKTLLSDMNFVVYRLMPNGDLFQTLEFDSKTYDPQLTNYLLLHTDRLSDLSDLRGCLKRGFRRPSWRDSWGVGLASRTDTHGEEKAARLRDRPDRHAMGADCATDPGGCAGRASSQGHLARVGQCDPLLPASRDGVAAPSARSPALADGLLLSAAVAA